MPYERILAAVAGTPWAIEPNKGREIAAILSRRVAGVRATAEEITLAKEANAARSKGKARPRGVALVPLYGVMTQRADVFTEMSGMCSTETVGRAVDEAAADPSVEAIVLDIDSPGGSVFGTAELGGKVAAAAKTKRVVAVANSMACSGAYWIASQASEIVVSPSSWVGSIGVYLAHVDRSEEMKQAGRAVTFVATSERKVAGNEYGPLGTEGKAEFESIVSGHYSQFVKAVASGRNVSQAKVKEEFGGGGVLLAEAAVRAGMADRIGTLDDVLSRYGLSVAEMVPAASRVGSAGVEIRKRKIRLA